jgi:ferritin-like metal-binding protein YciE
MLDTPKSLLEDQIKDLYSAGTQLAKALPKLADGATHPALKSALNGHVAETKEHVERLEVIADMLEIAPDGKKCKAMEGLIEEGKEVLKEEGDPSVIDTALVFAAQKAEHYEIAANGCARALADVLGETEVSALLTHTLMDDSAANKKLTVICEGALMPSAFQDRPADGAPAASTTSTKEVTNKKTAKPTGKADAAR